MTNWGQVDIVILLITLVIFGFALFAVATILGEHFIDYSKRLDSVQSAPSQDNLVDANKYADTKIIEKAKKSRWSSEEIRIFCIEGFLAGRRDMLTAEQVYTVPLEERAKQLNIPDPGSDKG